VKLGILTQYYPPEMGAPQARLSELAARFVKAGHEVFVLTTMPSYPHGRVFDGYSGVIRIDRLDGVPVTRTWSYASNSMQVTRRLANYGSFMVSSAVIGAVRLPAVDYLMTETPPLFLGVSGWLLARSRRAKWILNVSDLWVESAVRLGVLHEGRALDASRRLESFLSRRADLITGQSRGIIEAINESYPSVPTYHLSNGVDVNRFGPGLRSEATRAELGPDTTSVAIYAGLLGIAQGIDQLLEAAARLRDLSGFRLVIVGDGPDAERLRKMAIDLRLNNVLFLGPRPRDDVPALLASADIALVPLGTELPGAVPSKLYEAMGSGLPVVAVASGEPAEIVEKTGCGLAVKPHDIDALAAAIKSLVLQPEQRREFGAQGRQAAEETFNRDLIVEKFIDFLQDDLARGRP
jgi:colanic acid biosynthesis glycosyl transferase WcaI